MNNCRGTENERSFVTKTRSRAPYHSPPAPNVEHRTVLEHVTVSTITFASSLLFLSIEQLKDLSHSFTRGSHWSCRLSQCKGTLISRILRIWSIKRYRSIYTRCSILRS